YSFKSTSTDTRSINIYLTNSNNEIISLADNIDVTGAAANVTYTYSKTLPANWSIYKVYLAYQGSENMPLIELDDILISANLKYPTGCNEAPVASGDVIAGAQDRTASGYVTTNDMDPNDEAVSAYLITDSKDGQ